MQRLLLLGALVVHAQSLHDESSVIRASTRLVQVNVVVHDKNGPVANLNQDDFILTDRGQPRTVSLFSVETVDARTGAAPLPPNSFSNRQSQPGAVPRNVTIVLLDGLNTRFEDQANAKRQLIKFLNSVDPKDRIAIYTLGKTLRVLCDFTNGPEELQKVLASFRGSTGADVITADPDAANTGNEIFDQFLDESSEKFANAAKIDSVRTTFAAFSAIAGHVANLPGRKTLVWVTGSLPFSIASAAKAFNRANLAVYPVDARGLVGMPRQLTASAPSPKVSRTRSVPSFRPEGLETMQQLADLTGGRAFYNTNDLTGALRVALEDSSVTYTLGFYPESKSLDGKFHELKVQVSRPGLNVRYRKEYLASKELPPTDEQNQDNLLNALDSPLESSTIPLSAKLERSGSSLKISWSLDVLHLQFAQKAGVSNGAINVVFVQKDGTGKVLDMTQEAYDLHLKKEDYETYLRTGMAFQKSLLLKDTAKSLRILIVDRSDAAIGSLIIPLSQVK